MYKYRVEKEILQQLRRIYLVMLEALNHGLQHESKIALTLSLLTFLNQELMRWNQVATCRKYLT